MLNERLRVRRRQSDPEVQRKNYLMVAAIDFGTTFTGYGFSMRSEFKEDPMKVHGKQWTAPTSGLVSQKAPTTVLLNSNKEFVAFGYEAEDQYMNLTNEGSHGDSHYFRRFKMMLYEKDKKDDTVRLTRDTKLKSMTGCDVNALDIFKHVIKHMKEMMTNHCKKRGVDVKGTDILWVLTVPAIWTDSSKQFMREAAEKASIPGKQLYIALEPEAASLYCKHLPVQKGEKEQDLLQTFTAGSQYLVLDAGGGTVDITVHRVGSDGTLIELEKASGGDWGGIQVDLAFKKMLEDLIGEKRLDEYCHYYTGDYIDIFRLFELKKRTVSVETKGKITMKFPVSFIEMTEQDGKDFAELISESEYASDLKIDGDKVRLSAKLFISLFEKPCDAIVKHVKNLLARPTVQGTKIILMVGGFSESKLLQDKIISAFPECRVVIPPDAGLAVLKGAVIFGHNPYLISARVAKYTYGVDSTERFDPQKHPSGKRITVNGVEYCDDIFDIHVVKNQTLYVNQSHMQKTYCPLSPNQRSMLFNIYISSSENPTYIDDPCCDFLGKMRVNMEDTAGGLNRKVEVKMTFGDTELKVEGLNVNTRKKTEVTLDLLGEKPGKEK